MLKFFLYMNQGKQKFIFYFTFIAIGIYFAEVVSTNMPYALLHPLMYPAYGLLYIFFIDTLIRYNCYCIKNWYIFGALVGLITETYVAKVTFHGAGGENIQFLGVDIGAVLFIILFYHAWFSFIIPSYFAKRVLKMPLPIIEKRFFDIFFLFIPLFLLPISVQKSLNIGISALLILMSFSGIIFILSCYILKKTGPIKNILLTVTEKKILFLVTLLIYSFFFIFGTNHLAHNKAPLDFPPGSMFLLTFVIIMYLILNIRSVKKSNEITEISYNPNLINIRLVVTWIVFHISATGVLIASLHVFIIPILKFLTLLFGLLGISVSIYMLTSSTFYILNQKKM